MFEGLTELQRDILSDALARGATVSVDPEAPALVIEKLYLVPAPPFDAFVTPFTAHITFGEVP